MHDISLRLCATDPVCAMYYLGNRGITSFVLYVLRKRLEYSLFLCTRLFRVHGLSIARYLCPAQLAQLRDGPLSKIPESVERLKKNAPRMLRMSLQSLGFGRGEIDRMMSCSAMQARVRRCFQYAHDPETVATKMSEFWETRGDRVHRRKVLHDAIKEKGLEIRYDSVYSHDYIYGLIDVDLDEIVRIQYITGELFDSGGSHFWSKHHHACEPAFRRALLENGNTMDQSICTAIHVDHSITINTVGLRASI